MFAFLKRVASSVVNPEEGYTTLFVDDNGKLKFRDSAGAVTSAGVSDYSELTGLPTIPVVPAIPSLEVAGLPQTLAVATQDLGPQLTVKAVLLNREYLGNTGKGNWVYVLPKPTVFAMNDVVLTNVNSSNTTNRNVGSIQIPGDAFSLSKSISRLKIVVTADGPLANSTLTVYFSGQRENSKYALTKVQDGTYASNIVTLELDVEKMSQFGIRFNELVTATNATTYPADKRLSLNTLANLYVQAKFKFDVVGNSPVVNVTSVTGTLNIDPPKWNRVDDTTGYRKPHLQPFDSYDRWNEPIKSGVVTSKTISSNLLNTTSGTQNLACTAGSTTVTVNSTANLKVGMMPFLSTGVIGQYEPGNAQNTPLTFTTFGINNKIAEILNSTQVRMEKPIVTSLNRSGTLTSTTYNGCWWTSSPDNLLIHGETFTASMTQNPVTGTVKYASGSTTVLVTTTTVFRGTMPIFRLSPYDPIRSFTCNDVHLDSGWIFDSLSSASNTTTSFGEGINHTEWKMNVRDGITSNTVLNGPIPGTINPTNTWNNQNADKNTVWISEDGRYSTEFIGTNATTGVYTITRANTFDLYGFSVPYILDRPNIQAGIHSIGTRADGGGLIGGVVRTHELQFVNGVAFPDSTSLTETDAEIAANIQLAINAIPHAVAIALAGPQLKSIDYCDTPTTGVATTNIAFKGYKSDMDAYTPVLQGGTGYAVGDVVYLAGGSWVTQMRGVILTVSSGVPTSWQVTECGQYYQGGVPSGDGSALATTTSGAGTGLTLNVIAIPTTEGAAQTSMALAFTDMLPANPVARCKTYPATCVDSGAGTQYAGSIPIGRLFTLSQDLTQLAAKWLARRQAYRTAGSSTISLTSHLATYEYLAYCAAIYKYGAIVTDTAKESSILAYREHTMPDLQWNRLTGSLNGAQNNLMDLVGYMVAVENYSKLGKGTTGTYRAPVAKPLVPLLP